MLRFMHPKVVDLTNSTPNSTGVVNKQTRNPAKSVSASNHPSDATSSKRSAETSRLTDKSTGPKSGGWGLTAGRNTGPSHPLSVAGRSVGQSQKENTVAVDVLEELDLSTVLDEWHGLMVR